MIQIKEAIKTSTWMVRILIVLVLAAIGAAMYLSPGQAMESSQQNAAQSSSAIVNVAQGPQIQAQSSAEAPEGAQAVDADPCRTNKDGVTLDPEKCDEQKEKEKSESDEEDGSKYYGSPADYRDRAVAMSSAYQACDYLTFCRWKSVNQMPSASVGFTSMHQLPSVISSGLASLAFSVASLGMFILGIVLIFVISVDLLSGGIFTADYLFASITSSLLGITESPGTLIAGILIVCAISALVLIAIPFMSSATGVFGSRMGFDVGLKSLGIMFVALTLLTLMSVQSLKNHSGTDVPEHAPIAEEAEGDGSSITDAPTGGQAAQPGKWATFSPGWFVAAGNWAAKGAGGVVTEFGDKIASSIDSGLTSQNNSCRQYINGMHSVFQQTGAADAMGGSESVLLSYDSLMSRLYFHNYQMGAFGNSSSSNNAWCRIAENQSLKPAGDQLMLSRVAGLYGEAAGHGGLGIIGLEHDGSGGHTLGSLEEVVNPGTPNNANSGINVGNQNGSLVMASGNWSKISKYSIPNASSYIGPNFKRSAGGTQATMYFAACAWNNPTEENGIASAQVSKEWRGVIQADSDDDPLSNGYCSSDEIINNPDDPTKAGFGTDNNGPKRFNYQEGDEGWGLIGSWMGIGGSEMAPKFNNVSSSQGTDTNAAYSYYLATQGNNASVGLILSIVSVALIWLSIRYFGPIAIGALFAQVLSLVILIFLGMLFIVLLIPMRATRAIFMTAIKTLGATLIVTALITMLFQIVFNLATLITSMLQIDNVPVQLDPLFQSIISGVGAWLAFWAMRVIVHSVTGMNIASLRGGIQTGIAAASPVLRDVGFDVVSPLSSDFWGLPLGGRRRGAEESHPELRNDDNSSVSRDADKTNDKRDLIRDQDRNLGEKDRKNRESDPLLQNKKEDDKKPKWNDPDYLRSGRERRSNADTSKYDIATGTVNTAGLVPGPQQPWIKGAGIAMTAGGRAAHYGRKGLDMADQSWSAVKDSGKYAKQGASWSKDFLVDETRRQLTGDIGDRERGIFAKGRHDELSRARKFGAATEMMPGIPDLDRGSVESAGGILPTRDLLDREGNNVPGLMKGEGAERLTPEQTGNLMDTHNLAGFSDESGTSSIKDQFNKDASLSWMGGKFNQGNSGIYIPDSVDIGSHDQAQGEQLRSQLADIGREQGNIPESTAPIDFSGMFQQNTGADVPSAQESQDARAAIVGRKMADPLDTPEARQKADGFLGGPGMAQQWVDIRNEGAASPGAQPGNIESWSPPVRNKASMFVDKISSFMPMGTDDLNAGQKADISSLDSGGDMPAGNGGQSQSLFSEQAKEAGKRLAMQGGEKAANMALEAFKRKYGG